MTYVIPGATYRPVVNRTQGTTSSPACANKGLILHVAVGNGSLYNWFNAPGRQASSTWWVGSDGTIEQYVDPDADRAWAQAAGNRTYHSVETEGFPTDPLTAQQVASLALIYSEGHKRWGWPLALSNLPGVPGFGAHQMGGASWGGHTCPDPAFGYPGPRSKQRGGVLIAAAKLLNPTVQPAPQPVDPTPAVKPYVLGDPVIVVQKELGIWLFAPMYVHHFNPVEWEACKADLTAKLPAIRMADGEGGQTEFWQMRQSFTTPTTTAA